MSRSRHTAEQKAEAVARYLGGESPKAIVEAVGVTRRTLYKWRDDPFIASDAAKLVLPPPTQPDAPTAPDPRPQWAQDILHDLELHTVTEAIADGMAVGRALLLVDRRPSALQDWIARADKGEERAQVVCAAMMKAEATCEHKAVRKVLGGSMGWQGPAWWLERRIPETWCAGAVTDKRAASSYSDEDLLALATGSTEAA